MKLFENPYDKKQSWDEFYKEYQETPEGWKFWKYQRKYAIEEILTIILTFVLPVIAAYLEVTKQY